MIEPNGAWSKIAEDLIAKKKQELVKSATAEDPPSVGITTRRKALHQSQKEGSELTRDASAEACEMSHRSARPGARRGALGPLLNVLRRKDLESGSSLLDRSFH